LIGDWLDKMLNLKLCFYILFFVCFGFTTEVLFAAISDNVVIQWQNGESANLRMKGYSYVWMAFIYALIPILFLKGHSKVADLPVLVRLLVYTLFIYCIEFSAGFLLEQLIGRCPWKYTEGWHIMGYIRLDYVLFWMGFGYLLESAFLFLEKHFQF